MSDEQAKRGLWISIVVGAVLGFWWGTPMYGPLSVRTWNLMGLGVIVFVALFALVALLKTVAAARRAGVSSAPTQPKSPTAP
jgi:hypothetical protein